MVVAFLTIVSAGIFAAHILDALLGGAQDSPRPDSHPDWRTSPDNEQVCE